MAKPLKFLFRAESVEMTLEKIDRAKLYGYLDTEVQDDAGKKCELATLLSDGHSMVGKGGSALAYFNPDGLWCTRAELQPVDVHGKPITPVKSSFDVPITLSESVTVDEFLTYNIQLIYHAVPGAESPELMLELRAGKIFRFPFSYRGGVESSPAFLLLSGEGHPFMCVGTATAIEFVGPTATAALIADETAAAGEDEDALDFSLV
jgi:hypothetical protein